MADFTDSLREFMDQMEVEELNINTENNAFKIVSRDQANYFLRKVMDLRTQKEDVELTAKEELERLTKIINDWKNKESNSIDNAINYFSSLLEEYARIELENSEKKTIKLPYGTIGFKKQQPKYEYDEECVKKFLKKEFPDLLEEIVDQKFSKTDLKKLGKISNGKLYIQGKEVEGIVITELEDKFEIK